jgi:hypothetical protein
MFGRIDWILRWRTTVANGVPPSHAREFFGLLGGVKRCAHWDRPGVTRHLLAMLSGLTHDDINLSPALSQAVIPFLGGAYEGPQRRSAGRPGKRHVRRFTRRASATPARQSTPPPIASAGGTSPSNTQPSATATTGTR